MRAGGALHFVIPGDLESATGGYGYDRRIIAGLRTLGWQVTVHALDASFPQPSAAALGQAQRVLATCPNRPWYSSTASRWARCRSSCRRMRRACGWWR